MCTVHFFSPALKRNQKIPKTGVAALAEPAAEADFLNVPNIIHCNERRLQSLFWKANGSSLDLKFD